MIEAMTPEQQAEFERVSDKLFNVADRAMAAADRYIGANATMFT